MTTVSISIICNATTTSTSRGFVVNKRIDSAIDVVDWTMTFFFGKWKEIVKTDAVIRYKEFRGFKIYKESRILYGKNSLIINIFFGKSRTAKLLRRRI